jgi:hypothetical protein
MIETHEMVSGKYDALSTPILDLSGNNTMRGDYFKLENVRFHDDLNKYVLLIESE